MKRLLLVLFLAPMLLPAQEITEPPLIVSRQLFLPAEYYVGDSVELRLTLEGVNPDSLEIPSTLPDVPWIEIRDISIERDSVGSELTIHFTTYMPGTRTLPSIVFGEGKVLEGVKIHASSILDDTNAPFSPARGQLLLPGTSVGLILFGLLIFLGPVLTLLLAGKGRRFFRGIMERHRGRRPARIFYRRLRELEDNFDKIAGRDFYFTMTGILRSYLTQRTGEDFLSAASREFGFLCDRFFDDQALVAALAEMDHISDGVKFGGERVHTDRKRHDLALLKDVASYVERRAEGHRSSNRRKGRGSV